MNRDIRFAFFGTSHIAVYALEALKSAGFLPRLIVTVPDTRRGRGLSLVPSPVALWAEKHAIPTKKPESISDTFIKEFREDPWDVAIAVDYGKILPKTLLDVPRRRFLNVHPSLLPRLRGPSPIRSAILNDDRKTGVSIMLIDEEVDHGPIVAQKKVEIPSWPLGNAELEKLLLNEGGRLLSTIIPEWIAGNIDAVPQNDDLATYSRKIQKQDGLLDLSADGYANLLKIRAYEGWPGTYAYFERGGKPDKRKIRVNILDAHLENERLVIDRVKPEGKKEMAYGEFLRSGVQPA